jgi:hypothetical protein
MMARHPSCSEPQSTSTKDLNIGKIPVGQWFPNNIRGKIRNRKEEKKLPPEHTQQSRTRPASIDIDQCFFTHY